jgi:hypothetical protein
VDTGTLRIIDGLFARRKTDGTVDVLELGDVGQDPGAGMPPVESLNGMLTIEDARAFTENLEPGSSAAVLLFENTWASHFADEVAKANGQVVLNERIPRSVIEEIEAASGELIAAR